MYWGKNGSIEHSKGNETVPENVAKTRTEDDRGRDGGTNFILRIKEQETHLTLQEHDDDDDDSL